MFWSDPIFLFGSDPYVSTQRLDPEPDFFVVGSDSNFSRRSDPINLTLDPQP